MVEPVEVWLPVLGFEGLYQVSNLGRVRAIATGRILKPACHRGYAHVALYVDGKAKTVFVHRAMLIAFCGPPPFKGAQACHNDGDRARNLLTNLRWGSSKDNAEDRGRHGREVFGTGVRCSKLNEEDVRSMRADYRGGKSTYTMAKERRLSTNTVWCAVTGKTWKHVEGAVRNVG